ncbi:MAG TPA: energy transducer TonB [Longimicrobium sp.]|nr:energy transducer TonB [Longimicrobium sp.]
MAAAAVRAQDTAATHPPAADSAQAQTPRAYELADVEEQPELRNRSAMPGLVSRYYPREMRRRRDTGVATVRFLILREGTVDSTNVVVQSAPDEELGEAAARVVQRMRFKPARVRGQPVPVWVMLPIAFWMETQTAPSPSIPPPSGTAPRP